MFANALLANGKASGQVTTSRQSKLHKKTRWRIEPSSKFDTLCFLGVLTGDPFYVGYYKDEYAKLEPQLTPPAREALAALKRKIYD